MGDEAADYSIDADGGPLTLPTVTALHKRAFATDPVINYFMHTLPRAKREAYLPTCIATLLHGGAVNGATFDSLWTAVSPAPAAIHCPGKASPYSSASAIAHAIKEVERDAGTRRDYASAPACSAVWMPVGRTVDDWRNFIASGFLGILMNIGVRGCKRMLIDFQSKSNAAKRRGLARADGKKGLVEYHYLFFISTKEEERGRGYSSAVIRRFQDVVRAEGRGRPIWLESTTERSRRVYERCGFAVVDSWTLGIGKVGRDGLAREGGEGVVTWAMIWRPGAE